MQSRIVAFGLSILPVLISLLLTTVLILLVGHNPFEVFSVVWDGAFASARSFAGVINFWLPLMLASMGLVITFRAGLWNIGVEGQIMIGAICASAIALHPPALPPPVLIILSLVAAALGGMAWGLLIGILKTFLGVHEIFGGTALNALANLLSIYLISGPWLPAEGGSAQGTSPFPEFMHLAPISSDFAVSSLMLVIVLSVTVGVIGALTYTRWGLQLKATGKNSRSALLLGVPVTRTMLSALMICGALAGTGGAYRVLFTYNNLRPLVSGGIGFLGLLTVLLASMQAIRVPIIAFIFAAILSGSTRLKITLQLDQSLAGILQGTLVLISLFFQGIRERFEQPQK